MKIKISDLQINLVKYSYGLPNINFLVIHDNEDTGVSAALMYIKKYGGTIIDSQYGGVRNFRFTSQEDTLSADPNAIYTNQGIYASLNNLSVWKKEGALQLEILGKSILSYYNAEKPVYIFTLHNNLDSGFSISSYLPGGKLASTAAAVFVNQEMDPDDFIFVTRTAHFNYLKAQNVNVVLQSKNALDDGSLSIYAMYRDIPYINVEVQHGHLDEQYRLIDIAAKMLRKQNLLADSDD